MLYETLSQPLIILSMFIAGLLGGFVFDATNFSCFLCANKKSARIFFDLLAGICCFCLFFFTNLMFNYGEFRVYTILIFLLSILLERATIGNLFAKSYNACYTWIKKTILKIQERRAKKHESRKEGKKS